MTPHGNPDPAAIDVMVADFRKYAEEHPKAKQVDMCKSVVKAAFQHPNFCGTPGCHGGLYAVIHMAPSELGLPHRGIDFQAGANLMTEHLTGTVYDLDEDGISEVLIDWASDNPKLWGNDCGTNMFCHSSAFDSDDEYVSIAHIADHWEGVARRIRQAEDMR